MRRDILASCPATGDGMTLVEEIPVFLAEPAVVELWSWEGKVKAQNAADSLFPYQDCIDFLKDFSICCVSLGQYPEA